MDPLDDYGPPPKTGLEPNGHVVVDSYRQDIVNGFEKGAPIYNSMNPERLQSSSMVDLKDPIQIHLLTETALSDSKEYEILSQEEIDGLKKQVQILTKRMEVTRSNLLIQAKYRDAANSMAKLYSPTAQGFSGDPHNDDLSVREAEEERLVTEQRCQDLAAELFYIEKRLMEPKRRLLEHTAGILQLTHKASKKKAAANGQPLNGVPGSPESLYTYTQGRNSLDAPNEFYADEAHLDAFDDQIDPLHPKGLKNPLEIPIKSPIREQQSQLKDELDRSREENSLLLDSISEMEQRLESLNVALRDTIIRFNPDINAGFEEPPTSVHGADPADMLRDQLEYLEMAMAAVQAEQQASLETPRGHDEAGKTEASLNELWDMIHNGYTEIRKRQEDRRRTRADKGLEDDEDISDDEGIDLAESYSLIGFSSRVRWLYRQATVLKDQKSVLKRQIKQQRELNNKSDAEKDAELAQKQEELDQNHILLNRAEKDAMDAQTMLSEALEDLEQAREAANGAGEAQAELEDHTAKTQALEAKLRELQANVAESEADSQGTQQRLAQLDVAMTSLSSQLDQALDSATRAEERVEELENELHDKQAQFNAMEEELHDKQTQFNAMGEELQNKEAQHQERLIAYQEKEAAYLEKKEALKKKEDDFDTLNMSYVELKTEVTIARAELDGAYGTRAERAADVAAIQTNGAISKLGLQVEKLKSELAETVKELEDVTKETIGSEREKTELEGKLDEALSIRSTLEADMASLREKLEGEIQKSQDKISHLQDELDGERLKARDSAGRPGAGASVLSEKFRATMREERKKFQEDIKEERSRNRKLEEELAKLKRAQGPGKSPLSPR